MAYLMGVDLGTSSLKVLIMDETGENKSIASQGYDILSPAAGYAEQDCETWWRAAVRCIKSTLESSGLRGEEIVAIGFSGQMHGMVALEKEGRPVRPAILHCDGRSAPQIGELYRDLGKDAIHKTIYNALFPGFQLASLLWMKEEEPENYKKTAKVVAPKDYLRYRLTGELATDATDAAGTMAFDMEKRAWAKSLIQAAGLSFELYPEVGNSAEVAGKVCAAAARETGLAEGTPVVYGGGDQPVQALGNGVVDPGTATSNIGTSGQIYTPTARPVYPPRMNVHTFCNLFPETWYVMGAMLSAGLSLKWMMTQVLSGVDYSQIEDKTRNIPPCSEGLFFLPYLTGERTPHMNPNARAVFFGLKLSHDRMNMVKAVMEGVAFALKDSLEILDQMGLPVDKIIASGGGARSGNWLQIQADIFGREINTTEMKEQACTGAAMLAGLGGGVYANVEEAVRKVVRAGAQPIVPIEENVKQYEFYHSVFKDLYARSEPLFDVLAAK